MMDFASKPESWIFRPHISMQELSWRCTRFPVDSTTWILLDIYIVMTVFRQIWMHFRSTHLPRALISRSGSFLFDNFNWVQMEKAFTDHVLHKKSYWSKSLVGWVVSTRNKRSPCWDSNCCLWMSVMTYLKVLLRKILFGRNRSTLNYY